MNLFLKLAEWLKVFVDAIASYIISFWILPLCDPSGTFRYMTVTFQWFTIVMFFLIAVSGVCSLSRFIQVRRLHKTATLL